MPHLLGICSFSSHRAARQGAPRWVEGADAAIKEPLTGCWRTKPRPQVCPSVRERGAVESRPIRTHHVGMKDTENPKILHPPICLFQIWLKQPDSAVMGWMIRLLRRSVGSLCPGWTCGAFTALWHFGNTIILGLHFHCITAKPVTVELRPQTLNDYHRQLPLHCLNILSNVLNYIFVCFPPPCCHLGSHSSLTTLMLTGQSAVQIVFYSFQFFFMSEYFTGGRGGGRCQHMLKNFICIKGLRFIWKGIITSFCGIEP